MYFAKKDQGCSSFIAQYISRWASTYFTSAGSLAQNVGDVGTRAQTTSHIEVAKYSNYHQFTVLIAQMLM